MNTAVLTPRNAGAEPHDFGRNYWRSVTMVDQPLPELSSASLDDTTFRLLADNIPTLCWVANGDGSIIWHNRRWHEYCGTTPAAMEGWGWQSVHDPDLLPHVMERWTAAIAIGEACEMTFALRGADGVFRPFLTRIQPVRDASGRVARWFGVNTEISAQRAAKADLAAREAHLAALFEQSAAGLSEVDGTGRFVRVNDRFCTITGRAREELLGLRMHDITHPDDLPTNAPLFAQAVASGKPFEVEKRYIRPDGSTVWVHNSVTTLRDNSGQLRNTVCVTIDITGRKQAEQRLRESEARFRLMADSAPALIWMSDENANITFANKRYTEVFGQPADDLYGERWRRVVHPDDVDAFRAAYIRAFSARQRCTIETRVIDRANATLWLRCEGVPRYDESGRFAGYVGVNLDVTEAKQVEERLRESEARLRALTNAIPSFVWFATPDGAVHYLNDRWYAFTGQTPADALSDGWTTMLHPDDAERTAATWADSLARGADYEIELRYRRSDGTYRWYLARAAPLRDSAGTITAWFGTSTDIHDRKIAEAALRESEARLVMAQRSARAAAWEWDLAARIIRWVDPASIKQLIGKDVPQVIAEEEWFEHLHPDDVERRHQQTIIAAEAGAGMVTYRVIRDGEVRWLEAVGEVTARDNQGQPLSLAGITLDITERKRAEQRLHDSETRLRLAIDAAHMGIWELDIASGSVRGSRQLNRMLGFPEDATLNIEAIRARYYPGERERLVQASEAALRHPERFAEVEFRYCMPSGTVHWLLLRAQLQVDRSGVPVSYIGVLIDTTERKRAEEHQRLLINELNHRVKNTLAIVQGIAQQSFKGPSIPPEARHAFEGRLAALSAAHNLLTQQNWQAAAIHQIISDAVAAVGAYAERVVLDGPDLLLAPKTAVTLAMAIHELATNAVKYGSLSAPAGRIAVCWRIVDDRLQLVWREQDGPKVTPPARRGFGTRMIERGLAGELGGTVTIDFYHDGLVCTVDAPLPEVRA